MKRILLGLLVIAGIGGAMVAGTRAFFSDTETSEDNILYAGTIDISVNNQNPWTQTLFTSQMDDLKPGMSKETTFTVKNEGQNALVLWKRVNITLRDENLNTEPECQAEGGIWVTDPSAPPYCDGGTRETDIDSKIHYDMTVGGVNTIPTAWNVMMSDIDTLWIPLGKVEAGATLDVIQVYKLDDLTGDEYQGDRLTFDIDLYAEQLNGPGPSHTTRGVVLENKDEVEWAPIMDGTWGLLTWNGSDYRFRAWGLNGSYTYRVAYWDGSAESGVSSYQTPLSGNLDFTGTYGSFGSNVDAKYWLRPDDWDNAKTLWESNLVN